MATAANNGTRLHDVTGNDILHMRRALDEANLSGAEEGRQDHVPKVGAVLVDPSGQVVSSAHRGANGAHAEYMLLESAGLPFNLEGYTIFTTLEPCTKRNPGKIPCADRIISRNVSRIFIGMYDPNPVVYRRGWALLSEYGREMRDFTDPLRKEAEKQNEKFVEQYFVGSGISGTNSHLPFDYSQRGGVYTIRHGQLEFSTRWGRRGEHDIYAYGDQLKVELVQNSYQVDDPASLAFSSEGVAVRQGDTAVFRTHTDASLASYAFVKVIEVSNKDAGGSCDFVKFSWELRVANSNSSNAATKD
eukprot:TRINITY_DN52_c0_g1_i2.p1 TRINITY_DN52_c0_g1~~TRINITY_DN52_c0_g1_i2.p1  ORF type:complete len:303 (-),score=19.76 TRINITY_DN52_c0_g1_i2:77-985(-)